MRAWAWLAAAAALSGLGLFLLQRSLRPPAAPPSAPPAPGPTPAQADSALAPKLLSTSPEPLPPWTQKKPEILTQGARRIAHAVASARSGDLALSRSAAEDKARYELAKLIDGRESIVGSEVTVTGAEVLQTYTAADGTVYVELAAPVHR